MENHRDHAHGNHGVPRMDRTPARSWVGLECLSQNAFDPTARGPLSAERAVREKKRWFRRGQAWRAGIEPRIATLKHRFGLQRAFYKGEAGFERHVAFCVLAHNLVAMSRAGPC